jgi:hypothetical protein
VIRILPASGPSCWDGVCRVDWVDVLESTQSAIDFNLFVSLIRRNTREAEALPNVITIHESSSL